MASASVKVARVVAALNHEEPDRVPIGEFFWTNFVRRCKRELEVGDDFDPYRHWDLDLVVVNPNMDPQLTGIEVLEDNDEHKLVRTGYGATIERKRTYPMPHFLSFDTETYEQMEALEFDSPRDPRRYYEDAGRPDQRRTGRTQSGFAVLCGPCPRLGGRLLCVRQCL